MSDQEFENYLTLIGRLLRLSSKQRQAIGEELRDHFESRLAELMETGHSRNEAVRIALEEFGDAAGLAAQFSAVSQTRKRRLIMRCTVGTVAALAAGIVILTAAWPERQAGLTMERAGAQTAEKQEEKSSIAGGDQAARATERILNERTDVAFQEVALHDVLAFFKDKFGLQFVAQSRVLSDAGLDPTTIAITTELSQVRIGKVLEVILDAHGLGYVVDNDGLVWVSTREDLETRLTLRIYDCRKILAAAAAGDPAMYKPLFPDSKSESGGSGGFGAGKPAVDFKQTNAGGTNVFRLVQAVAGSSSPAKPVTIAEKLIDVLTKTIAPDSWSDLGGPGTVAEYGGLLVVSQTQDVHEQIGELLDQISEKLSIPAK